MPDGEPVAPAAPAPETSAPAAQGGEVSPDQWYQGLGEKERAHISAISKAYYETQVAPLQSELHGHRTEVGRLKKASDPVIVARLQQEERLVDLVKGSAVSLFGSDVEEDLKEIDSLDGLATALKFLAKGRKPAATTPAAPAADKATLDAFAEFMAKRTPAAGSTEATTQWRTETLPPGGRMPRAETVTRDNIDALHMQGKVTDAQYRTFLNTGQLP